VSILFVSFSFQVNSEDLRSSQRADRTLGFRGAWTVRENLDRNLDMNKREDMQLSEMEKNSMSGRNYHYVASYERNILRMHTAGRQGYWWRWRAAKAYGSEIWTPDDKPVGMGTDRDWAKAINSICTRADWSGLRCIAIGDGLV